MTIVVPDTIQEFVQRACDSDAAQAVEIVQELWSGYGKIVRYAHPQKATKAESAPCGNNARSAIVKWVSPPNNVVHPRGWNTTTSHQRKMQSYLVELAWYKHWSQHCDTSCRVPFFIDALQQGIDIAILIEDLDDSGFSLRVDTPSPTGLKSCLRWLAAFHAQFLGREAQGLWQCGTYWQLDTRKDELLAMADSNLKKQAMPIHERLHSAKYQTIIHGDAKIANFCFTQNQDSVAALDFQYVGQGVGVKDLAYFLGSCMDSDELFKNHSDNLDYYFEQLHYFLKERFSSEELSELEHEWRELYAYAVADFARFLQGWKPGHWKLNAYTEMQVQTVLQQLPKKTEFIG